MLNAEEPSRQFSEPLKRKPSDCKAAALSPSTLQWIKGSWRLIQPKEMAFLTSI